MCVEHGSAVRHREVTSMAPRDELDVRRDVAHVDCSDSEGELIPARRPPDA